MTRRRAFRTVRSERGAILPLFGLLLVFLLTLVAFAVDLGQARFSKRDEQAAADLAALDAGYFLAGKGSPSSPQAEPRRACVAAVQSVERNVNDFPDVASGTETSTCNTFPATAVACQAEVASGNPPREAVFTSGAYVLTVRYPIPTSELDTSRFSGAGVLDGTEPCQRMRIRLAKSDDTRFAGVIGINEVQTEADAVVRAATSVNSSKAPALLMVERYECGTLGNSSNGSGNLGIIVEINGTDPGVIHSDSNATQSCSGTTHDAYAIYGSPLSNGQPSIVAQSVPGPNGLPGIISHLATNGKGGASFPGGLSVAPTNGGIISRKPGDDRFNSSTNPAIRTLHDEARAHLNVSGAPAGYTTMGCGAPPVGPTKLYVDCDKWGGTATFTGVTEIVFRKDVEIKNPDTALFPNATRVVVRGQLDVPTGTMRMPVVQLLVIGDGLKLDGGGRLAVNSDSATSCASRPPGWTSPTKMAIFGDELAMDIKGNAAFCHTTGYLAGDTKDSTYQIQQTTVGGSCSATLPCPKVSGNSVGDKANFKVESNQVVWTAPNRYPLTFPPTSSVGLEDLAVWSEGDGVSELKSGGTLIGNGIFFAPNSDYEWRSPATGTALDAQFYARTMFLFQGTLRLRPNKHNTIVVPLAGNYTLIR